MFWRDSGLRSFCQSSERLLCRSGFESLGPIVYQQVVERTGCVMALSAIDTYRHYSRTQSQGYSAHGSVELQHLYALSALRRMQHRSSCDQVVSVESGVGFFACRKVAAAP